MLHQPAQRRCPKLAAWTFIHQRIVNRRSHVLIHTLLRPERLRAALALPQIVIVEEPAGSLLASYLGTEPVSESGGDVLF